MLLSVDTPFILIGDLVAIYYSKGYLSGTPNENPFRVSFNIKSLDIIWHTGDIVGIDAGGICKNCKERTKFYGGVIICPKCEKVFYSE